MKQNHRWLPWVLCFGLGSAMGLWLLLSSGALVSGNTRLIWSALSNACCLPGAVLLCLGLLGIAERHGQFDMLGYAMKNLSMLVSRRQKAARESYFDYKERRQTLRSGSTGSVLLISGLVYLGLAILFVVIYLNT